MKGIYSCYREDTLGVYRVSAQTFVPSSLLTNALYSSIREVIATHASTRVQSIVTLQNVGLSAHTASSVYENRATSNTSIEA